MLVQAAYARYFSLVPFAHAVNAKEGGRVKQSSRLPSPVCSVMGDHQSKYPVYVSTPYMGDGGEKHGLDTLPAFTPTLTRLRGRDKTARRESRKLNDSGALRRHWLGPGPLP